MDGNTQTTKAGSKSTVKRLVMWLSSLFKQKEEEPAERVDVEYQRSCLETMNMLLREHSEGKHQEDKVIEFGDTWYECEKSDGKRYKVFYQENTYRED